MTHNIKAGDNVKIITQILSYGAFDFSTSKGRGTLPTMGDVLDVQRVRGNVLDVTFEHCKFDDGQLISQGILHSDVELVAEAPTEAEPVKPSAPMTSQVLKLLQTKGSLTALEAGGVLKCRMLPFQINRLRNLGWKIKTELKKDPMDGQRYARYHLLDSNAA